MAVRGGQHPACRCRSLHKADRHRRRCLPTVVGAGRLEVHHKREQRLGRWAVGVVDDERPAETARDLDDAGAMGLEAFTVPAAQAFYAISDPAFGAVGPEGFSG